MQRGRDSNPRYELLRIRTFQARAFDRSATSLHYYKSNKFIAFSEVTLQTLSYGTLNICDNFIAIKEMLYGSFL